MWINHQRPIGVKAPLDPLAEPVYSPPRTVPAAIGQPVTLAAAAEADAAAKSATATPAAPVSQPVYPSVQPLPVMPVYAPPQYAYAPPPSFYPQTDAAATAALPGAVGLPAHQRAHTVGAVASPPMPAAYAAPYRSPCMRHSIVSTTATPATPLAVAPAAGPTSPTPPLRSPLRCGSSRRPRTSHPWRRRRLVCPLCARCRCGSCCSGRRFRCSRGAICVTGAAARRQLHTDCTVCASVRGRRCVCGKRFGDHGGRGCCCR